MTYYDAKLGSPVAFAPVRPEITLGSVISEAGLRQLHCAETEKYAHVTFFFNGGREPPYLGEERILIDSPRVVRPQNATAMPARASGSDINTYASANRCSGRGDAVQRPAALTIGGISSTGRPAAVAMAGESVATSPVTTTVFGSETSVRYAPDEGSRNANSSGGISNVPLDRGMRTYVKVLEPRTDRPDRFTWTST